MRPRIRTIKPEAGADPKLWDAEQQENLPLYRAYTMLWCCADREGRFEWRPRELKLVCLPWWNGDFETVLDALARWGFCVPYVAQARSYGWIPTLKDHQHINGNEPESVLPEPPLCLTNPDSPKHVNDTCETCRARADGTPIPFPFPIQFPLGGSGGKPKARKPRQANGWTRVPEDWAGPNDKHREFATKHGLDLAYEADSFRGFDFGKPKRDADRTFMTWLRNAVKWGSKASTKTRPVQTDTSGRTGFENAEIEHI